MFKMGIFCLGHISSRSSESDHICSSIVCRVGSSNSGQGSILDSEGQFLDRPNQLKT